MLTLLSPGEPGVKQKVFSGRMSWEGNKAIPYGDIILKERKKIHYNGIVFVTIIIANDKNIYVESKISVISLPVPETEVELSILQSNLNDILLDLGDSVLNTDNLVEEQVRKYLKKYFSVLKKRPLVKCHIIRN